MKLLLVGAHPDDIEFTCACTCQQAVELGWDVYEILMTSDEYGTKRNDFKGERIKRIRMHEMKEAAKAYGTNPDGTPKIKLIWFGEIDGHLPFNRDVFLRLKEKVIDIKPDIIIGPDSFFSLDLHNDHKHTGWLIYLVIKSLKPSERPILLLYHSFNTNFYIRFKDISIQVEATAKHKSQVSPLKNKILTVLRKLFYYVLNKIKTGPVLAEGFRRVNFSKDENQKKTLRHKILYYFSYNKLGDLPQKRYIPTPKELNLL
ncbi:MAG: PIG-L deacetylase family protein [Candidatus Helarchaeota archaeon]